MLKSSGMIRVLLIFAALVAFTPAFAGTRQAAPRGPDGKVFRPKNVAGKARFRGKSEVTPGDLLYRVSVPRALRQQIKDQVRAELGLGPTARIGVGTGFFRVNPSKNGRVAQKHELNINGIHGISVSIFEFNGKNDISLDVKPIVKVPKGMKPPRLPQDGRYAGFGLRKGNTYGATTDYFLERVR